jgi:hypothetical protein
MAQAPGMDRRPGERSMDGGPAVRRTVIDAEDLLEARRDPRVHRFWAEAIAYGRRLRLEGRDHSV